MATQPPVILAIDCSDRACSIALGDEQDVVEQFTDEPRQHAKKLLPMYRQLFEHSKFNQEDITAIAVAAGPGSFTGLRIGFSFAQALAYSLSVPIIKVSSLEALAYSNLPYLEDKDIESMQICLDARMGELYVASFTVNSDGDTLCRLHEDALVAVAEFDLSQDYRSAALIGSGFALDALSAIDSCVAIPDACIRASSVHKIGVRLWSEGAAVDALGAEPAYLRRETAWKNVEQQRQASLAKGTATNG